MIGLQEGLQILQIVIGSILAWLNFVIVDILMGLPEAPGVKGAEAIGRSVERRGGDISGGYFMGNIVCSPDASAGTLLASSGYYCLGGPEGGLVAALAVYLGNRLCADPGYAGTLGSLTATVLVTLYDKVLGMDPINFVAGMVIAITTIHGIDHPRASRLIGDIARRMGRGAEK
ncbi:hypothetical protein [Methanopyrus sp.]